VIIGIDTDALVHWAMQGATHHRAVRRFIDTEVAKRGSRLGLTPQVLHEALHVCTDRRRFENPLEMTAAISLLRDLWDGKETVRVSPAATTFHRTLELLESLGLGRKRILDTALAATLEAAGIKRLATLNAQDFRIFSFLEVVDPTRTP
jgi:predicted nucleic acid-binding protein